MIVPLDREFLRTTAFGLLLGALAAPAALAQTSLALRPDSAAVARARADSLRRPYTPADIHFMSGMIAHHAQAIAMARWAASHGASESVQRLADRIINAQGDEIVLMQHWLLDRNQPVPDPDPRGLRMTMGGMEHTVLMPGMLSDDQMRQLDAARGADFDRLFLTSMIQHHRGAIQMVRELFSAPGAGQDEVVWKFASDVNVDQTTEIARMRRMLVSLALGISAP